MASVYLAPRKLGVQEKKPAGPRLTACILVRELLLIIKSTRLAAGTFAAVQTLQFLLSVLSLLSLDPCSAFFCFLFCFFLVCQNLFHLMRAWNVSALLHTRPPQHPLFPRLEMWELINVHSCPPSRSHPAPVCYVRNCTLITNQIP